LRRNILNVPIKVAMNAKAVARAMNRAMICGGDDRGMDCVGGDMLVLAFFRSGEVSSEQHHLGRQGWR
jgi:hypothetical protein